MIDSSEEPGLEQVRTLILQLKRRLDSHMRDRWHRSLPLEELLFDRWERARSLGFGEGTSIYQSSYIYGDVQVGAGCWIGPFTLLDGSGGLEIGDHCDLSAGVQIYTHDTAKRAVSGGKAGVDHAPVRIGSCCYIGPNVIVQRGVTIGEHTIVGACSFVNRDIPPYSMAIGTPCRRIGRIVVNDRDVDIEYDHR